MTVAIESIPLSRCRGERRKKALDKLREHAWEPDWITEMLKEALEHDYGIDIEVGKIYWSLGHCQGDGVGFEARLDLNAMAEHDEYLRDTLAEFVAAEVLHGVQDCTLWTARVNNSGNFNRCGWGNIDVYDLDYHRDGPTGWLGTERDEVEDKLCKHLRERIRTICEALAKQGYAEIEYLESDEQLLERAKANGWEFDENGDLV